MRSIPESCRFGTQPGRWRITCWLSRDRPLTTLCCALVDRQRDRVRAIRKRSSPPVGAGPLRSAESRCPMTAERYRWLRGVADQWCALYDALVPSIQRSARFEIGMSRASSRYGKSSQMSVVCASGAVCGTTAGPRTAAAAPGNCHDALQCVHRKYTV